MIRLPLAAAAAFLLATPALAGPFDGVWKADMSTFKASAKPYTRLLAKGHYHCTCSNPPEDFPVDGKFHAVTGHPGYDKAMGEIVDAKTVRLAYQKNGKTNFEVTSTLADDGATIHDTWKDTSAVKTVTGDGDEIRVGPAPKGAHAVSGVWRDSDKINVSDEGSSVTLSEAGDRLTAKWSDGSHWTARVGGPFVKVEGLDTPSLVSVARQGPRTLVVTGKAGGKLRSRTTWTLAADGRTMKVVSKNLLSDRTESFTVAKQ